MSFFVDIRDVDDDDDNNNNNNNILALYESKEK